MKDYGPVAAAAGAVNADVSLFVRRMPQGGEEVPVERITRVPGGKAANVAVAMARLLKPATSGIIGALGEDPVGDWQLDAFRREGVDSRGLVRVKGVESGQAYILIDEGGQNAINTYFGANATLKPVLLEKREVKQVLSAIHFLVVMDTPLDFTHALLWTANRRPVPCLWAPGVRTLQGRSAVTRLLKYVDYLVLNESESLNLTGSTSLRKAYAELRKHHEDLKLIVTRGREGAFMLGPRIEEEVTGVDLGRAGLKVVNTVGCGDAFIGCFAAQMVLGRPLEEALKMANYAGSFKATRLDTRGSPTADELASFASRVESPSG
ncbi:MAG TPA: carbohydrate kinase family protein [Conexivisphaerales archaeon]|nr:carbohydrate kinase family protein [Conexivisphaerales archaeon]